MKTVSVGELEVGEPYLMYYNRSLNPEYTGRATRHKEMYVIVYKGYDHNPEGDFGPLKAEVNTALYTHEEGGMLTARNPLEDYDQKEEFNMLDDCMIFHLTTGEYISTMVGEI
jgi:hypothetical protein